MLVSVLPAGVTAGESSKAAHAHTDPHTCQESSVTWVASGEDPLPKAAAQGGKVTLTDIVLEVRHFLDILLFSAIILTDRKTNPSSGGRMHPAEIRLCSLDP